MAKKKPGNSTANRHFRLREPTFISALDLMSLMLTRKRNFLEFPPSLTIVCDTMEPIIVDLLQKRGISTDDHRKLNTWQLPKEMRADLEKSLGVTSFNWSLFDGHWDQSWSDEIKYLANALFHLREIRIALRENRLEDATSRGHWFAICLNNALLREVDESVTKGVAARISGVNSANATWGEEAVREERKKSIVLMVDMVKQQNPGMSLRECYKKASLRLKEMGMKEVEPSTVGDNYRRHKRLSKGDVL